MASLRRAPVAGGWQLGETLVSGGQRACFLRVRCALLCNHAIMPLCCLLYRSCVSLGMFLVRARHAIRRALSDFHLRMYSTQCRIQAHPTRRIQLTVPLWMTRCSLQPGRAFSLFRKSNCDACRLATGIRQALQHSLVSSMKLTRIALCTPLRPADTSPMRARRYADSSRDASWTSARRRGETSSLAGMHIDDGDASGTGGGGKGDIAMAAAAERIWGERHANRGTRRSV